MPGTNYPGSLDDGISMPNPNSTDNTVGHAQQHDTANAALKAIEAKLGTGASTPGSNDQLLCVVNGATIWQTYSVGGDLTGSLPNPSLASTGVAPGTYGSGTLVPVITVDGKGRITSVSTTSVIGGGGGGGASPLTNKGDIWVFSTVDTRLPVGANGQLLSADSTQPSGLKWVPAPTSAVWGSITGTLSSQTDLNIALNARLIAANNLSDLASATTARTNLGLGSIATKSTITLTTDVTGVLPAANGGAGAVSGILKANGTGTVSAAVSGTDYAPATAITGALKGNGAGGFAAATLNDVAAATADYSLNSHKITNLLDPTAAQDAATKNYVDNFGTTTLVENEVPVGLINGSNTAYTTASTYATGSLRVYLNGQRLTSGSGNDYVEATSGFTMQYAPATGDVLTVDYNVTNSHFIQGSNSIIVQETPTGTVNGSTTLFTVLQGKYVANTLEVFVNGLQQTKTTDYIETSPGSGTFTFITAPLTGDVVKVSYQFSTGASGNADTTDGAHASVDPAASTIPITDSNNVARVQTYKNLVINGGCQIAQRVTAPSLSTTSQYGAVDRFRVHATGTAVSAGTIAQGTGLSFGATGNSLQVSSATITGTGQIFAKHRIESRHAITLKNLAASFACLVNHNVGSSINYQITIRKPTASDNYTSTTDIQTVAITVPTGTPTIIKLENVALGDVSNGIEIEVRADCGAVTTKTFDYTNFVFAQGAIAQGFAAETFERELRSCQRYYEKSFNYATAPAINTELKYHNGSAPTGLGGVYCDDFFQVTKRTAATITFWGTASANWEFFDGAWQNGTTSDNVGNDRRIQPFISRSSGTGFNDKFPYIMRGNWTADAEL